MTIKDIYEKVNLVTPLEQRRFFNYLEDTFDELSSMYREFVFDENEKEKINSLDEKNPVRELFHPAIVDNILFLAGGGDRYKSEFIRKSKEAWLYYWHENAKHRRLIRMDW